MFQENSIETCTVSGVKQITSPGWMHETSARTWCTGKTKRERVEREVGGGMGMGNTCKPMAVSFQCMTKFTTKKKKSIPEKKKRKKKNKFFSLPSKTLGCFSGCLMSTASDQKLFCRLCSPICCSFDEFVEEKVISASYSSTILTPL